MRDSTLRLLRKIGLDNMVEATSQSLVGQFRSGFLEGFGEELPERPEKALALVKETLERRRPLLEAALGEACERILSEDDALAMIAFLESPLGARLAEVGNLLQNESGALRNTWENECLRAVEPELAVLLNDESAPAAVVPFPEVSPEAVPADPHPDPVFVPNP